MGVPSFSSIEWEPSASELECATTNTYIGFNRSAGDWTQRDGVKFFIASYRRDSSESDLTGTLPVGKYINLIHSRWLKPVNHHNRLALACNPLIDFQTKLALTSLPEQLVQEGNYCGIMLQRWPRLRVDYGNYRICQVKVSRDLNLLWELVLNFEILLSAYVVRIPAAIYAIGFRVSSGPRTNVHIGARTISSNRLKWAQIS